MLPFKFKMNSIRFIKFEQVLSITEKSICVQYVSHFHNETNVAKAVRSNRLRANLTWDMSRQCLHESCIIKGHVCNAYIGIYGQRGSCRSPSITGVMCKSSPARYLRRAKQTGCPRLRF